MTEQTMSAEAGDVPEREPPVHVPPDETVLLACDWADYKANFGASGSVAYGAFTAGWNAGRHGEQSGVQR